MSEPVLKLDEIVVLRRTDPTGPFGLWGARPVRAVDGVSLTVDREETLGLMGGSGAGKTTLAQAATLRLPLHRGNLLMLGEDVRRLDRKRARRRLQLVPQDPRESLDMDRRVDEQLDQLVRAYELPDGGARIRRALERVGLPPEQFLKRTPRQMSGGEQQRLAIAQALVLNPLLVALDEPVSGVDPRLREELLDLLADVQREQGVAYLLISQDLRVIGRLARRVAIMHLGRICEVGPTEQVLMNPRHPYSRRFLGKEEGALPPDENTAGRVFAGCPWAPHCPHAVERCTRERPAEREVAPGHLAACHVL